MPEFIAEHTPRGLDSFTTGYLDSAEWLLPEYIDQNDSILLDRDKLRGWTQKSIRAAKRDCREFQRANAYLLAQYCELSGRTMESAGIDFWLSRNGHGAGYFDRGNESVFNELQDRAREYGTCDCEVYRNRMYLS